MLNSKSVSENDNVEIIVEIVTDKFVQCMQGAYFDKAIKTCHTLSVYTALCLARYGKTNRATISMKSLTIIARTSAKSARADIKLLQELGYIKEIKSGKKVGDLNTTNTYIMHDEPVPFEPLEDTVVSKNARKFLNDNPSILDNAIKDNVSIKLKLLKKEGGFILDTFSTSSSKGEVPVNDLPVEPARKKRKFLVTKKPKSENVQVFI